MKRLSLCLLALIWCVFAVPAALGADDCCWDWSPGQAGIDDAGEGGPKDKVNSAFAQCTNTAAGGGAGGPCFRRDGRQMVWFGYTCIAGGSAPDTNSLPTNEVAGFYCWPKAAGPPPWPGGGPPWPPFPMPPPPPPAAPQPKLGGAPPDVDPPPPPPEDPAPPVPAVSTVGFAVLAGLVLVAALWMIRRRNPDIAPPA